MGTAAFGQLTSWNDVSPSGSGGDFTRLPEDGDYDFRFLTEIPFEYPVHWVENSRGKRSKIKCAGRGCPVCERGEVPKNVYLCHVINRKLNRIQVYEFGKQVFDQIKKLALNPKWGDIRGYDVTITKDVASKPQVYNVSPDPAKNNLTDEEKADAMEFMKRMDLNKLSASAKPEEVNQKLAEIEGGTFAPVAAGTAFSHKGSTGTDSAAPAEEKPNWDFEQNFPDFS